MNNRDFEVDGADDVDLFAKGEEEPTRLANARFGTLQDLLGLGRNRQDQEPRNYGRQRAGKLICLWGISSIKTRKKVKPVN
jgi:hypothetical protein